MKIQDFLNHHGVSRNPFAEEDAQTDNVFKTHCIDSTFHVSWEKIFGDPGDPSTSIIFGEKGSGKTALRLQIEQHVNEYNAKHRDRKLFVINYNDFNPFLDQFAEQHRGRLRRTSKLLGAWRLWDHMDSILSLGVTKLVDQVLIKKGDQEAIDQVKLRALPRDQRRDLMLLAACYDQSKRHPLLPRFKAIKRRLRFHTWKSYLPWLLGVGGTLAAILLFVIEQLQANGRLDWPITIPNVAFWGYLWLLGLAWLPWAWKFARRWVLAYTMTRKYRVGRRDTYDLCKALMRFTSQDTRQQPFPNKDRTDDRYELLGKFQNVLEQLGYGGVLVLVDRLDEPDMINGQSELMRAFIWPLLDNKFLKHPGIGLKMMLPIELRRFIDREDRDFYQRARLDKQNMIPSLQWTGAALHDLASARLKACALDGESPSLRGMFDTTLTDQRLIDGFQALRVPRHLFKFLYRLMVAHCNAYTEDTPVWEITNHQFESVLAVYTKEIEAADAGTGI